MKLHQSGDKIIVTELRPMSEAPRDGTKIIALTYNECFASEFLIVNYSHDDHFCTENELLPEFTLIGWMPMPIYQPEKS